MMTRSVIPTDKHARCFMMPTLNTVVNSTLKHFRQSLSAAPVVEAKLLLRRMHLVSMMIRLPIQKIRLALLYMTRILSIVANLTIQSSRLILSAVHVVEA